MSSLSELQGGWRLSIRHEFFSPDGKRGSSSWEDLREPHITGVSPDLQTGYALPSAKIDDLEQRRVIPKTRPHISGITNQEERIIHVNDNVRLVRAG